MNPHQKTKKKEKDTKPSLRHSSLGTYDVIQSLTSDLYEGKDGSNKGNNMALTLTLSEQGWLDTRQVSADSGAIEHAGLLCKGCHSLWALSLPSFPAVYMVLSNNSLTQIHLWSEVKFPTSATFSTSLFDNDHVMMLMMMMMMVINGLFTSRLSSLIQNSQGVYWGLFVEQLDPWKTRSRIKRRQERTLSQNL